MSQRETGPNETLADIPEDLYNKLITGHVSADAICLENVLDRLTGKLEEQNGAMACHPTACLWLQDMEMIYSMSTL